MEHQSHQTVTLRIEPRTLFLIGFFLFLGFVVVELAKLILAILTAVVIASFIESISRILKRVRIPRVVSVIFFFLATFSILALIVYIFIPVFINELIGFASIFGEETYLASLGQFIESTRSASDLIGSAAETDPVAFIQGFNNTFSVSSFFGTISNIFGGILNALLILVLSFYLAIQDRGVEQFLRLVTPVSHESYVISLWHRIDYKIGQWFRGQMLIALITAALSYIALTILGVPYALLLALLVGVSEFVPFGIFLAAIPVGLIAFLGGGISLFVFVGIAILIIQQIENYILQPLIINRATGVPSLMVLLSVVIGVSLAGFYGLILSIPAAVLVLELVLDAEKRKIRTSSEEHAPS